MRILKGMRTPWWGRVWRIQWATGEVDVLPIPLCYIARLIWNIWCASFRIRRNQYEAALHDAYCRGREDGASFKAGGDEALNRAIRRAQILLDLISRGANLAHLKPEDLLFSIFPQEDKQSDG